MDIYIPPVVSQPALNGQTVTLVGEGHRRPLSRSLSPVGAISDGREGDSSSGPLLPAPMRTASSLAWTETPRGYTFKRLSDAKHVTVALRGLQEKTQSRTTGYSAWIRLSSSITVETLAAASASSGMGPSCSASNCARRCAGTQFASVPSMIPQQRTTASG